MENVIQQIDPANPINWRSNLNSSLLVRLIAGKNQSALQAKGFGQRPQIWVQNGSPAIGSNFGRPGGIASFNFNGTDAWFQPSVLSSYLTGSAPGKFSMLMWVRCTENVNANYSFYGSFGNFFGIHSNLLAMQNGAQAFRVSSYTVPTNKWEHYAACYDGAVLNFYVNGVFNSSVSYTGGNLPGNDGNPFNSPSIGASATPISRRPTSGITPTRPASRRACGPAVRSASTMAKR